LGKQEVWHAWNALSLSITALATGSAEISGRVNFGGIAGEDSETRGWETEDAVQIACGVLDTWCASVGAWAASATIWEVTTSAHEAGLSGFVTGNTVVDGSSVASTSSVHLFTRFAGGVCFAGSSAACTDKLVISSAFCATCGSALLATLTAFNAGLLVVEIEATKVVVALRADTVTIADLAVGINAFDASIAGCVHGIMETKSISFVWANSAAFFSAVVAMFRAGDTGISCVQVECCIALFAGVIGVTVDTVVGAGVLNAFTIDEVIVWSTECAGAIVAVFAGIWALNAACTIEWVAIHTFCAVWCCEWALGTTTGTTTWGTSTFLEHVFVAAFSANTSTVAVLAVFWFTSNNGIGDWVHTKASGGNDAVGSKWSSAFIAVGETVITASKISGDFQVLIIFEAG
jgi:hypothetical protein